VVDPQPGFPTGPSSRAIARRILHAWRGLGSSRELARERANLPAVLESLVRAGVKGAAEWVELSAISGDPAIFLVGPDGALPACAIRIAQGHAARRGLTRAAGALDAIRTALGGTEGGAPTAAILPGVLGSGEVAGRAWLAELALPGRSGRTLLGDPAERSELLRRVAEAMARVHAAGAVRAPVTDSLLGAWVDRRIEIVRSILATGHNPPAHSDRLAQFGSEIRSALDGRDLSIGWIHGDLWPANVLVRHGSHELSGVVDWDSAGPDELRLHDLLHLAITTRRLVERRPLGEMVASLLGGAAWTADDKAAMAWDPDARDTPAAFDGLDATTALRLYWLRAIELNIDRHPAFARQRGWVRLNVVSVLA
jgi:aminoglycoside phosphotransferase (APT) family kinase protein